MLVSQPGKVRAVQESAVSPCFYVFWAVICRVNTAPVKIINYFWVSPSVIMCPYRLKVQRGAAGRPRHSSCLWHVATGPLRKAVEGCQGFGPIGAGSGCRLTGCSGKTADSPGPPEPGGAAWARELSRQGCAAPSCRTPPPHRREGKLEARPPSGPAGLRSDGCREEGKVRG